MGTTMLLPIILSIIVGSLVAIPQEEFRSNLEFLEYHSNLGDQHYRLVDTVYPHTVDLDLDVYLSDLRFNGLVTMGVEVRESGLTQIAFHQKVQSIQAVDILTVAGTPVPLLISEPFTTDDYYELIKINLNSAIAAGNYTIMVRYTGVINENPLDSGFYKGHYFLNNQERAYATTQFAPYDARKAFPCFDEPMFKSRYTLAITRDMSLSPSYSNMAISATIPVGTNRVREVFYPTPIISAYLIAFHVSDFVETEITSTAARPFKIISRPGVNDQHQYAAEIGVKITNELDDFLGIQYHEMGQGVLMKNDHIAIPDFAFGAMENWGMINYREMLLLYDPNNTNLINKISIAAIVAHELAHQWFGNLVTCFWWSNLWLNESYASYFEYFAAHWADPSLELDDQFVVDYVHSALAADAGAGAAPMNWVDVANKPSVISHFSTTSYAKGASVLRMMEHFIGTRNFRNALRYYLRDNAYEVGYPINVYDTFRQAVSEDYSFLQQYENVDVGAVFESWVNNPGSPVVNVNVNHATGAISISQQRYLVSDAQRPDNIWQIPLTWTDQRSLDFTNTRPSKILTTATDSITTEAGDYWVLFNIAQSGLYRVNYNDRNWELLADYLKSSNRERIHYLNRAQIVNDLLYFIRSGDVSTDVAFNVLDFLRYETNYYVWAAALGQIDFLRRRLEHLHIAHTQFTNYILELMETVIEDLGFEERPTDSTSTILNRMQILNYACNLGHAGCVEDALKKFTALRENNVPVPVNYRRYVYCVGMREGTNGDYVYLLQKYEASENAADMVIMLRAMACTKNAPALYHYLAESLRNRRIRLHDRTNAWNYALQGNPDNLETVLYFLYERFEEIRDEYGGPGRLSIAISALSTYLTNFDTIQEYQAWVYENQVALGESFGTAVAVVNTALNNLAWGNANAPEIYKFLLERSVSSSTTFVASTILMLAAMFAHLLR